jgi:AraC-like DNA-binding protein
MYRGSPVLQEHTLAPQTETGAIWMFSPEHPKLYHLHGQLELLVVKRGRAVERIGNRTYTVHAGQLLFTLPGIPHEHLEGSSDLDMRIIHLETDLVKDLEKLSVQIAGCPVVELSRQDYYSLLDDCDDCSIENAGFVDRGTSLPRIAQKATLAVTRDHAFRTAASLAELACWLIRQDPGRDRKELCKLLDVSGAHLSRCFSAELGTTIQEQRSRLRAISFLHHAVRKQKNLLEAALIAGFGSYSQCSRVFYKLTGTNPREYLHGNGRNRLALRPR